MLLKEIPLSLYLSPKITTNANIGAILGTGGDDDDDDDLGEGGRSIKPMAKRVVAEAETEDDDDDGGDGDDGQCRCVCGVDDDDDTLVFTVLQ